MKSRPAFSLSTGPREVLKGTPVPELEESLLEKGREVARALAKQRASKAKPKGR